MEKGTLIILKGKKGFNAKILFTKPDGKIADMPALGYYPSDEKYNNTECTFRRDKGQLIELIAHDGVILVGLKHETHKVSHQGSGGERIPDSYAPFNTFLPFDSKEALRRVASPDNFALKFNKAARFDDYMNKFQFFKREKKGENYEIKESYGHIDFGQIAAREYANAKALLSENNVQKIELTTDWRMTQGLGIESVYETSITLHHVYGIPYIPASALKGVVRSWIITEFFESKEDKALADASFCNWFGCPTESHYKEIRQGKLSFFDIFPLVPPKIKVDVINPHYQPYYGDNTGKTPPADYHNPVPVFFLTITNTKFQVMVGSKIKGMLNETINGKTILNWLQTALTDHGIGAKTAVGYGYMKPT